MTLPDAAARAQELAQAGDERALAQLRADCSEEIESAARDSDHRVRVQAYGAIGPLRFRQKEELLRRGLEDPSPACRGAALLSLEQLSRESPGPTNAVRALLHELASHDPNAAVRRLAIVCLRNASPRPDTIRLLEGLAADDEQDRELRDAARKVAAGLTKKSRTR